MDLSPVEEQLPSGVAVVAVGAAEVTSAGLFPEEAALLSERATPRRVAQFALGRHAAHLALGALGLEAAPVLRGERREPIWPEGVVGSITHDASQAIAMVARRADAAGVGIDLEAGHRYFEGLEHKVAFDEELAFLDGLTASARRMAVIEIFSAKESIYKAHYPRIGRFFGFETARVELGPERIVGYFAEVLDPLCPTDRPMEIGRMWDQGSVVTWLVLPPE